MSYRTTTIDAYCSYTGDACLHGIIAVTITGLSLPETDTYTLQACRYGQYAELAATSAVSVSALGVATASLTLESSALIAELGARKEVSAQLYLWNSAAVVPAWNGPLRIRWAPAPTGFVTSEPGETAATAAQLAAHAALTTTAHGGEKLLLDQTTPQTVTGGTPVFAAGLTAQHTTGRGLYVYRNNAEATTGLVRIHQDSATDDEHVLEVFGDGTGDIFRCYDGLTRVFTVRDGAVIIISGETRARDVKALGDAYKFLAGAGSDASFYYDGTNGYVETDLVAASDLHVKTGTAKTLVLDTPVWDDLRITPGSFDRPGTSDPAIVAYTPSGSGTVTYLYEFNKNNLASFTVQFPHNYKVGSDIAVHLHWTPGARGTAENGKTVGWKLDYTWANIGAAFGTMTPVDLSDACDGVDHAHQMTPDVTIDGHTAAKGISSMLICNVKRTDTGTDDTWATNTSGNLPMLLEIDFHYQIDTIGSRQQSAK